MGSTSATKPQEQIFFQSSSDWVRFLAFVSIVFQQDWGLLTASAAFLHSWDRMSHCLGTSQSES